MTATLDTLASLMTTQTQILADLRKMASNNEALLKMIVLSQGQSVPITTIATTLVGDLIGTNAAYRVLWQHNLGRIVAAQVVADFDIPGSIVSISRSNDASRNGEIAVLSSSGAIVSPTIWIKPNDPIYIASRDTTFSLAGSKFRVLLFDPMGQGASTLGNVI